MENPKKLLIPLSPEQQKKLTAELNKLGVSLKTSCEYVEITLTDEVLALIASKAEKPGPIALYGIRPDFGLASDTILL